MLHMDGEVTRTSGAQMMQWHYVTCGTGKIRFDAMENVFVGSTDVFAKHSRVYIAISFSLAGQATMTNRRGDSVSRTRKRTRD